MKPKYIEFNGKHPSRKKEDRVYLDNPPKGKVDYGASYSSEFLKVDIDDYNHKTGELEEPIKGNPRSEIIVDLLDYLGIKYNGIRTEHGKHLFFRTPKEMEQRHKENWYVPIGVKCEWKFPASDDHIPLKINGVERQFFKGSIDNEDIDELPFFLYPLQKSKNKPFDINFQEGNRTQKLGAYLFHLVGKKYTAEQAYKIVQLMNEYVFDNPIPESTLKAEILNDSTLNKLQEQQKDKDITHSSIAKEIIDNFVLITVNGSFYSYENGVYKPFPDGRITKYLTENYPKLNSNFEREVIRHIKGLTYIEPPEKDDRVNVINGILNFDNGNFTLLPHSKEYINFRQFNAAYDPEIESKLLDDTLLKWFNNDLEQIELFNQMLGYLLMNNVNYQKIFFFIGVPHTGKTTVLKLIRAFCGEENVSSIQFNDMNKPFGLATIVNKTANIFMDTKKTKVLASDIFKMLADGSPIKINQKYKQEFVYCFTGKLLFGMNNYPDFSEDFEGIERRLVIFEFKHIFEKTVDDYDPELLTKLLTDEVMTALLNKAVNGYKSLIKNKGFIYTKASTKSLNEFVSDNDTVIRWLYDMEITEDYLLREPIKNGYEGLYPEYQNYCISIGETSKPQKDFTRTIKQKYDFKTYRPRINKIQVPMFTKG